MSTNPKLGRTELLDESSLRDAVTTQELNLIYQPFPNTTAAGSTERPVWRVQFEMVTDPSRRFGLDINGEVVFGRGSNVPNVVDMTPYDADIAGVSRNHLLLRPTANNLLVMDLGSTNGTMRNGRTIGRKTPYSLIDGDVLSLGKLQFYVHIIERPHIHTQPLLSRESTLAEALSSIAKAITSQIDLDDVLNQVAQTAKTLTSAGEADIWLVDQNTGELFPEVQRSTAMLNGSAYNQFQMNHDPLVHKVIQSGNPVRAEKNAIRSKYQLGTSSLMEALAYIPIMLGGISFGVLRVGHREHGRRFDDRDEQLLIAIADFAAIAIQNARLFQATDQELQRRVRELSALNEVSRSVSSSLDLQRVYQVLVDEINKYCPVEEVRLFLRDPGSSYLRALSDDEKTSKPTYYPLNRGFLGEVVQFRDAIVTNDIDDCPGFDEELDGLNGRSVNTIAGIPLKIQNRVVGVLNLVNKLDGEFTEENIALLLAFANPVATAIENSSLFAESNRQRRAIQATAEALTQPLLLLDKLGNLLVSNEAANKLLAKNMSQLFEAISRSVGRTMEVAIEDQTYLSTTEHLPDVGTIIVMQDITYVKKLEQDRSDFLHMLSHDLKNPLMAITGWSSLIERTITNDDRGGQYVAEIHIAADRMLKMINQLLQTVGQEASVELLREPCSLLDISAQILDDVKGVALSKNIDLQLLPNGQAYSILGDKTRLYHMILNLMDNAIKYSPNNTAVTLTVEFSSASIVIQVADEGPGIPDEDLERIFNKYFRSNQTGSQSGSGLGLAAVKAIAEAHGGQVTARNGEEGTVMEIILPATLRLNDDSKEE